jgi:hypothetical protein
MTIFCPMFFRKSGKLLVQCLASVALLTTPFHTMAQGTWDGGGDPDGNFNNALNWAGDTAPAGNGALVFDGTVNLNTTNNLTLTGGDNAITFNAGAGAFSLNANAIRIGGVANNSAFAQTINLQFRLNGGRTVDVGAAGMIFTVAPQSTGGGRTLTKLGSGVMTLRGNTTGGNVSYTVNAGTLRFDTLLGDTTSISTGNILLNSGTQLQLNNAGTATFTLATANSGSSIVLNNSGTVNGAVQINSGANLTGNGSLAGSITNFGGIAPGTSIGTMTLGNLVLDSTGTTTMEIDAEAGQNADLISVTGTLTLGGSLTVVNIGGALEQGDTFNLFDAATLQASFGGTVNLPALDVGLSWDTSNLGISGIISVIPEPSTLTLAAIAGALLFRQLRRRSD